MKWIPTTVAVAATGLSLAVQAGGLIGDEVIVRYDYDDSGYHDVHRVVVGSSIELDGTFAKLMDVNIAKSSITVNDFWGVTQLTALGAGIRWRFEDLSVSGGIGSVAVQGKGASKLLAATDVTFGEDWIDVYFHDHFYPNGSTSIKFVIGSSAAAVAAASAVPEPETGALLLAGGALVGAVARRKRRG